jgi:hypothetical protein
LFFLFFAQDITHGGEAKLAGVNVRGVATGRVSGGHHMAGFEVATYGRFWVATEGCFESSAEDLKLQRLFQIFSYFFE